MKVHIKNFEFSKYKIEIGFDIAAIFTYLLLIL